MPRGSRGLAGASIAVHGAWVLVQWTGVRHVAAPDSLAQACAALAGPRVSGNYPTHGLELAAIIFALMATLSIWLALQIYTDYKNLKYIYTQKKLNLR